MSPAEARALAARLLAAHGFAEAARSANGESVYLKRPGNPYALRVSSHTRTPKQRRNHPDSVASLVLREPTGAARVEALVQAALRDFEGQGAVRAREERSLEHPENTARPDP